MTPQADEDFRRAACLLRDSRSTLAFTGAGISVESGIPPFRGAGGVWESYDQGLLEIGRFRAEPEAAWRAIKSIFYDTTREAQPNAAHRVLAAWEAGGRLDFLVTQNIDGLHRAAGSRRLAEFHGSLGELVCESCGAKIELRDEAAGAALLERLPPRCPRSAVPAEEPCGGLLKPNFVFFGEAIPAEAYRLSFEAAERAELCLVIGSTGSVYPAAQIPRIVKRRGGMVIEVDPAWTEFSDEVADIHLPFGAVEALLRLDALLKADF